MEFLPLEPLIEEGWFVFASRETESMASRTSWSFASFAGEHEMSLLPDIWIGFMFLLLVVTHDHLQSSGQFTSIVLFLFYILIRHPAVWFRPGRDCSSRVFHKRAVTMTTYMLVFRFKTTTTSSPNRELLLRITIEIIVINMVVSTAVLNNPYFSLYLIFYI